MKKHKILLVSGARPNFMKIAPIIKAMKKSRKLRPFLVHTGQHYDQKMYHSFFKILNLPKPDVDLGVGSGSHAEQTARIMIEFEKVLLKEKPRLVVVVGDVNSTLACAIVAKKLWIEVAHVEAGLRSGDRDMPEEINRIVTDSISDYFFVTEPTGERSLKREGVAASRIFSVGNVMIDTLLDHVKKAEKSGVLERLGLRKGEYCTVTLHRPSNVDDKQVFKGILEAFKEVQKHIKVIFPAHPRTVKMIEKLGLSALVKSMKNLMILDPVDYLEMLKLNRYAKFIMTDSGGIQEESTVLKVPCLTLRHNTERPITVDVGTNALVGNDPAKIRAAAKKVLAGRWKKGKVPFTWDGKTGQRIVKILENKL